jgi:hypothetical protein
MREITGLYIRVSLETNFTIAIKKLLPAFLHIHFPDLSLYGRKTRTLKRRDRNRIQATEMKYPKTIEGCIKKQGYAKCVEISWVPSSYI